MFFVANHYQMQQVHHIQALLDIGASACFIDKRYGET